MTEKLVVMKEQIEDAINEAKHDKFREMITKHTRIRAEEAAVLVVGSIAKLSEMLAGGVGNVAACLASEKEVQEKVTKAHTKLEQLINTGSSRVHHRLQPCAVK